MAEPVKEIKAPRKKARIGRLLVLVVVVAVVMYHPLIQKKK